MAQSRAGSRRRDFRRQTCARHQFDAATGSLDAGRHRQVREALRADAEFAGAKPGVVRRFAGVAKLQRTSTVQRRRSLSTHADRRWRSGRMSGLQPGECGWRCRSWTVVAAWHLRRAARVSAAKLFRAMNPSSVRNLWDMLPFAYSTEYFPLTLTLSLREREQRLSQWCLADGRWA